MSNVFVYYIGNDNIIELDGLKNDLTGAPLDAATVTVTLTDAHGAEVGGDTWPRTLAHVPGSRGLYRAILPHTLALAENQRATATVTVDAGDGLRAQWALECVARRRQ